MATEPDTADYWLENELLLAYVCGPDGVAYVWIVDETKRLSENAPEGALLGARKSTRRMQPKERKAPQENDMSSVRNQRTAG